MTREAAANERLRKAQRQQVLRRVGQVLMIAGGVIALVHVGGHLFGAAPSLTVDMLAGYPMAAVMFLAGLILWGQAPGHL